MLGRERPSSPARTDEFGLSGFTTTLTFIVAFGLVKAAANFFAGLLRHSTIHVSLGTDGYVIPSLEASLTAALDNVYRTAEPATPADVQSSRAGECRA